MMMVFVVVPDRDSVSPEALEQIRELATSFSMMVAQQLREADHDADEAEGEEFVEDEILSEAATAKTEKMIADPELVNYLEHCLELQ